MLSPKPLDEIQPTLVCKVLTRMRRATVNFFDSAPWGGVKYHLISITKSISKIFTPNFVCVLTNERYKTYQTGFSFCGLDHACPRVGTGALGVPRGSKKYFFQTWSCGISNRQGDKQNRMQENFHPRVKLVTLGEVKRSNNIKFQLHVNFKDFCTKLCECSHK